MSERALKCPQCNAPLSASRFARSAVCAFCGTVVLLDEQAVSAARFREAFRAWNRPAPGVAGAPFELAGAPWCEIAFVARGEHSDVFRARRARWPSEEALLKVLRADADGAGFEREWEILSALAASTSPGAEAIVPRLPQPIAHGTVASGAHAGARATLLRWAPGFVHTFEDVRRAYTDGIAPRAAVWIWRRILEALAFVHATGFVHGAVLPEHLLIERGEHGVRLVGFAAASRADGRARAPRPDRGAFDPPPAARRADAACDLAMSARAVSYLLGQPSEGTLPQGPELAAANVPEPLAELLLAVGDATPAAIADGAWALRETLGGLAERCFGAPRFCPLAMPDDLRRD